MNDKNPELTETYISAVVNHQKGNLDVAEGLYKKILEKIPNHINTQTNLGGLYSQTNNQKKAVEVLQKVLKIDFMFF